MIKKLLPFLILIDGDLRNKESIVNAVKISNPDEIYNLASISSIDLSYKIPELVHEVNGLGLVNLLEAIRLFDIKNKIRIYQASSSEMFGKVEDSPQNETTSFNPISPYGKSKVFAHLTSIKYRKIYDAHISCGILYNHESEFRRDEFVTRKITKGVVQIRNGNQDKIRLGTLESSRDWGYAGDYVEAMWRMLQQEKPSDYVIATGKAHSVRNYLEKALQAVGLDGVPEDYVIIDEKLKRPAEVGLLVGDASKAKNIIGWEPKISFEELVVKMVNYDLLL
jgi:GDPmannose 4,6-dehydratase